MATPAHCPQDRQDPVPEAPPDADFDRAFRLFRAGDFRNAFELCRRRWQEDPQSAGGRVPHLMGVISHETGRLKQAVRYFGRAVEAEPQAAQFHFSLGQALHQAGDLASAEAAYRRAVFLGLEHAALFNNLGKLQGQTGRLGSAEKTLRRAILLNPRQSESYHNLGNILRQQWRLEAAIDAYRQAVSVRPGHTRAHSNLVFALNYSTAHSKKTIAQAHRRWAHRHAEPIAPCSLRHVARDPDPDRRLRIGYVSADFRSHPVAFFVEPLLAHHDHVRFHITGYSTSPRTDAVTGRLRGFTDSWRDLSRKTDEEISARVVDDRIDILVDLMGHTAGSRLMVFARKPAPVQVTYLGYPNTTGMSVFDGRFTDRHADPEGRADPLYSERLVRLPGGFCCYGPPEEAPVVGPLPALKNRHITFGCFNDPLRINPPLISLWVSILNALPDSRLFLQTRPPGDIHTARRLLKRFEQQGVGRDRVRIFGYRPFREHLGLYGKVDIALDTFPFNGHTNTCHALWMGVPVITLAGGNYISRMGASILTSVGIPEFIAADPDQYVAAAVGLARDRDVLQKLRTLLRPLVAQSALTDGAGFTAALEDRYRDLWRQHCRHRHGKAAPGHGTAAV